jgi:hypothetical protein
VCVVGGFRAVLVSNERPGESCGVGFQNAAMVPDQPFRRQSRTR